MDKKAKDILFKTYWSSKGWKLGKERTTLPEDLAYAKEKGLMFDPITISHDECVDRIVELAKKITMEQVTKAFLCSLSTRRLDWRSAVGSYYISKMFVKHSYTPIPYGGIIEDGKVISQSCYCKICRDMESAVMSSQNYNEKDLNVLNFERIKWGGVRHGQLLYTMFDLEQFAKDEIPEPTQTDVILFKGILKAIESCNQDDWPGALRDKLASVEGLKTNKNERSTLIEILACIGVLKPKSYNRPEAGKHDWHYAAQWRGEDGYDKDVVENFFGSYLN